VTGNDRVMLADLEAQGRIRRRRSKGRLGLLVEITDPNTGWFRGVDSGCSGLAFVSAWLA